MQAMGFKVSYIW